MQLFEKYKPNSWSELVGHKPVVRTIQLHQTRGTLGGRAIYISGPSGSGKSSIAWLIACELAEPWNIRVMDAGPLTGNRVLELEDSLATYGMGEKQGRVVLINEAHALRGGSDPADADLLRGWPDQGTLPVGADDHHRRAQAVV